jgi:P4 family phage/plasmid primase-like protien
VFEGTLAAFDMARVVAREYAAMCNTDDDDGPNPTKIASASTVSAIERLARSDRRHAVTVDIWDDDPWLLNTPSGIVDLKTGSLLSPPRDPAKYMTKITAVAPGGDCPRWLQFLAEVTGGNVDYQAFLQRLAGYTLTGSVKEHAWFFLYGTGGNGKGVFLNTLFWLLHDYAAIAPIETFVVTHGTQHPTDLAGFRGARLVLAQETEKGQRWSEAKIKTMTGGDPITARFMRQDFFTYMPQFKLWIGGNHKPAMSGVDPAHRRRTNLLPFTVAFKKPDTNLPETLKAEGPGILRWAIGGCLEYQRNGLAPPLIVKGATEDYLNDQDVIGRWIDDCCTLNPKNWAAAADLWDSFQRWADANNERAGTQRAFSTGLGSRDGITGGDSARLNQQRGFWGISLNYGS